MSEAKEHEQFCTWLKIQHPGIVFNSDMSGIKLSIGQAVKIKKLRSSRAFPDIVIYEPRTGFVGLFIEMKRTGEKLFKRNGDFKTEHLREQSEMLQKLRDRGFMAEFAIGFDEAVRITKEYFAIK